MTDTEPGIELLQKLCIKEGYEFKISDGMIIIADIKTLEQQESVECFTENNIIHPTFEEIDTPAGVRIINGNIDSLYRKKETGEIKRIEEHVFDEAQARRWARGYYIDEWANFQPQESLQQN